MFDIIQTPKIFLFMNASTTSEEIVSYTVPCSSYIYFISKITQRVSDKICLATTSEWSFKCYYRVHPFILSKPTP